jgi:PAS domain S-box-containing protein
MTQEPSSPFVTKVLLRQSIASDRLVIALFTVASFITKLLYDRYLPALKDIDAIRWIIIILGTLLFIVSFFNVKRRVIVSYFSLFLYVSTLLYVITYVAMNHFDPTAVILLLLVYGASSVVINSLLYYGIQSVITILICAIAYSSLAQGDKNLIGFLDMLIGVAVFGVVMIVRLKHISDVRNSFSNLERLNVLSIVANKNGDIVYISPSAKSLLGYSPHELMKDGWWLSANVRDGWINREYILNYPIIPKEIMSIESSLLTKDGKKLWFSWENSMLPNGNYMGVALDITKYKLKA